MDLNRFDADIETRRAFLVAVSLRDQAQHLGFPVGDGGRARPGSLLIPHRKRRRKMMSEGGIDVLPAISHRADGP
jgi:hypothetical protein